MLTKQKLQVLVINLHYSCSCLQCKGRALQVLGNKSVTDLTCSIARQSHCVLDNVRNTIG